MKRILITGSTQGLGLLAGKKLLQEGHEVVFHARSEASKLPEYEFVIGDISTLAAMKSVAEQANSLGPFHSIIHNAGVYDRNTEVMTKDGFRTMFAVNVLAPYVLTCLLKKPERLIFLSSGMHRSGNPSLGDLQWSKRNWDATQAYCDSKFFDLVLTKAFSRLLPKSYVNAVDPGWVPTRMGGAGAPDNLDQGAETQAWLSVSSEPAALVTGKYFHHKAQQNYHRDADSLDVQDGLLSYLGSLSGISFEA